MENENLNRNNWLNRISLMTGYYEELRSGNWVKLDPITGDEYIINERGARVSPMEFIQNAYGIKNLFEGYCTLCLQRRCTGACLRGA